MRLLFTYLLLLTTNLAFAQSTTISGKVLDVKGEPLLGANIKVQSRLVGSTSNINGDFSFPTNTALPITIEVSMVGFFTEVITLNSTADLPLQVTLLEDLLLAGEVVVSASRVEEGILESAVSIEKLNILDIQQAPTQDFYGSLVNQKNVDMSTQSLTFRSLSLRGFNANGNTRLVQLVDGMDNQAPGLNFAVGNIVGVSELDLESVELLPGASSALYGPNAINGIILLNSKNPFDYPGLSVSVKSGLNHIDGEDADPSLLYETNIRYALPVNDKLAVKVNVGWLNGEDWYASDTRDRSLDPTVTRESSPGYEGINIYGDETSTFLPLGAGGEDVLVTRTGFAEADMVDYTAKSLKLSGALHYKFSPKLEGILQANYGSGQTVYTGIDRYAIQGFTLNQYKAELRSDRFMLRAYTTQENSGDSYAAGTLALALNETLKPSELWFQDYGAAYAGAIPTVTPLNHQAARAYADRDVPQPGSAAFESAKDQITATPLSEGGAKFLDKTDLYAAEGTYRFKEQIPFADVIVGANYRLYALNSEATLFALDEEGEEFSIAEYGAFVQGSKKLLQDKLKLTASLRFDKNENFDGRSTPRLSVVYEVADQHFIRASYQTGFRMPTTQAQYIDLPTPQARLIGGLPFFKERYDFEANTVYNQEVYELYVGTFLTAQGEALAGGQTAEQAFASAAAAAAPVLEGQEDAADYSLELEQNQTYELGYKSLVGNRVMIDAYYYYSSYNNFSGSLNLFQSSTDPGDPFGLLSPTVYQANISLDQEVQAQGAALGISVALDKSYTLSSNYAWNELINQDELPTGFLAGFNTPRHKLNLSFANRKLTERLGFNISWRWQDAFVWESTFAVGEVPAYSTIDAQLSYKMPSLKSVLKVGGSNLSNQRFEQAIGNPTVGALYYISVTFDQFMRN